MAADEIDAQRLRRQIAGARALAEALDAGLPVRAVFVAKDAPPCQAAADATRRARDAGARVRELGPRAFARLRADADESHLIALVGPEVAASLDEVIRGPGALWLLVDASYPGNAGFVVRNAEVSGAAGVVIDAGFDRGARRDALRSSLRADRLLPVFFAEAGALVEACGRAGRPVIAIEDAGDRAPWEVDLTGRPLLVAGGEGSGIPAALLDRADAVVRIPMAGFIPAYNLQAAVAAVAAERLRQLAGGGRGPGIG